MKNKKSIIVLGSTGMLGLMVFDYLSKKPSFDVIGTTRIKGKSKNSQQYFCVNKFFDNQSQFSYLKNADYIINCIGIIKPHCKDDDPVGVLNAIEVNALFPHKLTKYLQSSNVKIIQIATDCVYSGKKGNYIETDPQDALDVYGKTKSLGEVQANNLLNIRCSIIGPEKKNKLSLLEWFLSQDNKEQLTGYENHLWNGVTTLQFSQICEAIISNNSFTKLFKESHVHHFTPNTEVNKYELLNIFKKAFNRKMVINKGKGTVAVDRRIKSKYTLLKKLTKSITMEQSIEELNKYMQSNL